MLRCQKDLHKQQLDGNEMIHADDVLDPQEVSRLPLNDFLQSSRSCIPLNFLNRMPDLDLAEHWPREVPHVQ